MAGINPNLGNNLRLQQIQLSKTAEVDTQKAEDKKAGDAKIQGVWLYKVGQDNPGFNESKVEHGDYLVKIHEDGTVHYYVWQTTKIPGGTRGGFIELGFRPDLAYYYQLDGRGNYDGMGQY